MEFYFSGSQKASGKRSTNHPSSAANDVQEITPPMRNTAEFHASLPDIEKPPQHIRRNIPPKLNMPKIDNPGSSLRENPDHAREMFSDPTSNNATSEKRIVHFHLRANVMGFSSFPD
jgi:hypothetical protein